MTQKYRYRAFISYSHQDADWGDWLHDALETFRVPDRLAGRATRDGIVPDRLFPVFRDREELPTSASLGTNICEALRQSRYLVVICSPRSARSRWVNEEIRSFKQGGGGGRVLCLIVDGEPNASANPGGEPIECFAPALRSRVNDAGELTAEAAEPIAADARPGRDGRKNALLKLVAGLLGVRYDELKQRDHARRRRQRLQLALGAVAALVAVAAVIGATTGSVLAPVAGAALVAAGIGFWQRQERDKRLQREWQEQQMAEQLRLDAIDRLCEAGRLAWLEGHACRAAVFLGGAYDRGADDAALRFLLGQAARVALPVVLEGHEEEVAAAAFAHFPDLAVTASYDGTGRLWEAASGSPRGSICHFREGEFTWPEPVSGDDETTGDGTRYGVVRFSFRALANLGQHLFPLAQVALDADGIRYATRGDGHSVSIFTSASRRLEATLSGHTDRVNRIAFSFDGARVVTASDDCTARVWDAASGAQLASMRHACGVGFAEFTPDGRVVITVSEVPVAWDAATGAAIASVEKTVGAIQDLALNPDCRRYATASRDTTARVWAIEGGSLLASMKGHSGTVRSASFSNDWSRVATGSDDRTARIWDAASGRLQFLLEGHVGAVGSARFDDDGCRVITASRDRTARIWDVFGGRVLHRSACGPARFSPDGRRLVTANERTQDACIWDLASREQVATLPGHTGGLAGVAFSRDGERLCTARGGDNALRIWDSANGAELAMLPGHADRASFVGFSPDARILVSRGGLIPSVKVWDLATGACLQSWEHVNAFGTDGTRIVTHVNNGPAVLRDATSGNVLATLDLGEYASRLETTEAFTVFAPGGERAVTFAGRAILWDARTGKHVGDFPSTAFYLADARRFSDDGARFVLPLKNRAEVRAASDGRLLATLEGHLDGIYTASFSHDGHFVITGSADKTARIWDAASGRLLAVLDSGIGHVAAAEYSPDGHRLALWSTGAAVKVWDLRLEDRPPAELAKALASALPWKLENGRLVAEDRAAIP